MLCHFIKKEDLLTSSSNIPNTAGLQHISKAARQSFVISERQNRRMMKEPALSF